MKTLLNKISHHRTLISTKFTKIISNNQSFNIQPVADELHTINIQNKKLPPLFFWISRLSRYYGVGYERILNYKPQNKQKEYIFQSNNNQPKKQEQQKQQTNEPQSQQPKQPKKQNENKKQNSKNQQKKSKKRKQKHTTNTVSYWQQVKNYYNNYKFRPPHLIILILLMMLYPYSQEYTIAELLKLLEEGKVQDVRIISKQIDKKIIKVVEFRLKQDYIFRGYVQIFDSTSLVQKILEYPSVKLSFQSRNKVLSYLIQNKQTIFRTIIILIFLIDFRVQKLMKNSMGGKGGFNVDFQKKKFQMVKDIQIRFKDVAGLQESKFQIQEFVDFLKNPDKYKEMGARIPKGALLTGPPGTGKTLLAKACAGEAGVPFFFASGSDFVEMFVGVGAARMRDLFKTAKAMSPSIIFIDEIDAVGRKRQNKISSNDQKDGTLNQLLVEMDGFGTDSKVIVLAATNRKELLDAALVRPGRFDRTIEVNLPDLEERKQILLVHLKPLRLSQNKTIQQYANRLATLTPGFSGAELANLCNQAAILAARKNKPFVQTIDFQLSSQRIIGGVERKSLMNLQQKRVVSVHQSGHAVISWFLQGAHPLLKVTIIPRAKGSLGFAQYLPNENKLQTKQEFLDKICFILGGRCAQEFFFNRITTGAYDDLQKAYQIAQAIVRKFGMSELGYISYQQSTYLKDYSQGTSQRIDKEIKKIIEQCTQRTRNMVKFHQKHIKNLSDQLLKMQTLDGKQIRKILGERPFTPHPSYKSYLGMQDEDLKNQKKQDGEISVQNKGIGLLEKSIDKA